MLVKKVLLLNLMCVFTVLNSMGQNSIQRPKENWVMRSVLDKRARTITVFLHEDMQIAMDANNCGLYKVWKGGTLNKGTIWNHQHGPQPVSVGPVYTYGLYDEPVWQLFKLGEPIATKVQFRGYLFKNNQVTFRYEISPDDGSYSVWVEESPEYVQRSTDKFPGLERKYTVYGLPAGTTLKYTYACSNLARLEDVVLSNTGLNLLSKTENYQQGYVLYDIKGFVTAKTDQKFSISTFFNPKLVSTK